MGYLPQCFQRRLLSISSMAVVLCLPTHCNRVETSHLKYVLVIMVIIVTTIKVQCNQLWNYRSSDLLCTVVLGQLVTTRLPHGFASILIQLLYEPGLKDFYNIPHSPSFLQTKVFLSLFMTSYFQELAFYEC